MLELENQIQIKQDTLSTRLYISVTLFYYLQSNLKRLATLLIKLILISFIIYQTLTINFTMYYIRVHNATHNSNINLLSVINVIQFNNIPHRKLAIIKRRLIVSKRLCLSVWSSVRSGASLKKAIDWIRRSVDLHFVLCLHAGYYFRLSLHLLFDAYSR